MTTRDFIGERSREFQAQRGDNWIDLLNKFGGVFGEFAREPSRPDLMSGDIGMPFSRPMNRFIASVMEMYKLFGDEAMAGPVQRWLEPTPKKTMPLNPRNLSNWESKWLTDQIESPEHGLKPLWPFIRGDKGIDFKPYSDYVAPPPRPDVRQPLFFPTPIPTYDYYPEEGGGWGPDIINKPAYVGRLNPL